MTIALPHRATLAPLALVSAYALVVLASPAVSAADMWLLLSSHLTRNATVLFVIVSYALIVCIISALLRQETRERLLERSLLSYGHWLADKWPIFVIPPVYLALLLSAFSLFKQFTLPAAGFGLDLFFAEIDRAIFLGVDPWRVTHWLVPSATGTWLVDLAYVAWFVPMLLLVLLSGGMSETLRAQYLLAFALVWIVAGTVFAYLLPAAGPCYVDTFHSSAMFSALEQRLIEQSQHLAASGGGELLALRGQSELMQAFVSRDLMLAGGISAMPSLHTALAVLFACAARTHSRITGQVMAAFAFVIWFGSVHLGWHYAIDGLIGGVMAIVLWRVAGAWAAQLTRTQRGGARMPDRPGEPIGAAHL